MLSVCPDSIMPDSGSVSYSNSFQVISFEQILAFLTRIGKKATEVGNAQMEAQTRNVQIIIYIGV